MRYVVSFEKYYYKEFFLGQYAFKFLCKLFHDETGLFVDWMFCVHAVLPAEVSIILLWFRKTWTVRSQ